MRRLHLISFSLVATLVSVTAQARTASVERLKQAGEERISRRYLRDMTREVGVALRHAGYRLRRDGTDELWKGRLSVQRKRYAAGRVFHLELERRDGTGRLIRAGDKYVEIHNEPSGRRRCPWVARAKSIYCGFQHLKYIARWLVRWILAPPTEPPRSRATVKTGGAPIEVAGMVYVPAGEFVMGGEFGEFDEVPRHKVYLDAYYLDRLEVTNEDYRKCVKARRCRRSRARWNRHLNEKKQPVVSISWYDARNYCRWAGGKRLPTEAEWEKAARGTDERRWPWGSDFRRECVNLRRAGDPFPYTAPVGSFPCGASPYGALDMAGNAWEWCYDWWDGRYYGVSPYKNPRGPKRSPRGRRCMRGGTWKYPVAFFTTTTNRSHTFPTKRTPWVGFRCAKSESAVLRDQPSQTSK